MKFQDLALSRITHGSGGLAVVASNFEQLQTNVFEELQRLLTERVSVQKMRLILSL